MGLMVGALRVPYENIVNNDFTPWIVILSGITGFAAVIMLEKLASKMER
jgi:uncharacterized membrane protein